MSKFSKRERTLLIATAAITLATISYGFILEPVVKAYSGLSGRIDSDTLKLEKSYRLLKREDEIKEEYMRYSSLVKPQASEEEEIAAMLKVIEATARTSGIYITNIRPQPVRDKVFYKEFLFELTAESEIDKLIKFIYDLQVSGNLLRVRKLILSTGTASQKNLKAVLEISKPSVNIRDI